jgi:hypothetical protein
MKTPIHLKTLTLALTACFAVGSSSAFAAVISFNSVGAATGGMVALDTAGAPGVNVDNWNNMHGKGKSGAFSGSIAAGSVLDDGGVVMAGMITTWSGNGGAGAGGSGSDDAMMWSSEWDLFSGSPSDMNITVTNVPYAQYDVYFYVDDADSASTRGGDVVANGVTESITMFSSSTGGYTEVDSQFTWNSGTTGVGSYLRIEGLSGDLDLDMFARNSTTPRLRMSGFQIVAVPEPSAAALLGLGGLALILRRRK